MLAKLVPDEELMLQVRDGAGEMLGELFDRYQTPLFNFYAKLTGDRAISEDLVQEVFLRVLKYRQSYKPGTPFRAWVYQIARNARADHYRKQRPETNQPIEVVQATVQPDGAQQSQESILLHRALMQLPDDKREVLVLSRFQEMKYDEIARLLGCEPGAVKVRVHRALQELKQIYNHLQAGGSPQKPNASSAGTGVARGEWQ
jgi:RNA polymerase sigma factor (sigma-70 family)